MSEENTPEVPATPAAPAPGSPEYNAQMAAEGAAAMGHVPAKFKNEDGTVNMEAFVKSYAELEKQFHQPSQPAQEPVQEVAEPEPIKAPVEELRVPDAPEEEEATEPAAPSTVVSDEEMSGYVQEIMAKGDISAESRADLVKRGIPESLISSMVEGHRARMNQQFKVAGEIVGGEQRLHEIFGWAAKNLSVEQRAAVNAGLAGTASEATLLGLAAMYDKAAQTPKASEPREAPRYGASAATGKTVAGFATKAEYYAAANDPKMVTDPKYRADVEARMIKTNWTTLG